MWMWYTKCIVPTSINPMGSLTSSATPLDAAAAAAREFSVSILLSIKYKMQNNMVHKQVS